jgi:hypothetical protein
MEIGNSAVLAGQRLGIKEVDDAIWLVSLMRSYFTVETKDRFS